MKHDSPSFGETVLTFLLVSATKKGPPLTWEALKTWYLRARSLGPPQHKEPRQRRRRGATCVNREVADRRNHAHCPSEYKGIIAQDFPKQQPPITHEDSETPPTGFHVRRWLLQSTGNTPASDFMSSMKLNVKILGSCRMVNRKGREPQRTHCAPGVSHDICYTLEKTSSSMESHPTGTCKRANVPRPMGMGLSPSLGYVSCQTHDSQVRH